MSDRTVVFVCLHGAAKSLIAATLFQRLADERGLAVRSTFAGTEPDPAIQPNVVARLLEEGVDVRPLRPRRVTRDELASAWRSEERRVGKECRPRGWPCWSTRDRGGRGGTLSAQHKTQR